MSDIILHLGGDWRRIERTAIEAQRLPGAVVLISSEGRPDRVADYLESRGIQRERTIYDAKAYDTVGNFTDTYPWVRRLGAKTVYVVTSHWHMPRAMAIAAAAYALTGIRAVACPWRDPVSRQDRGNTCWDVSRTVKWRIDGRPTSRNYRATYRE